MTNYAYFLFLLLATTRPKLRFATIELNFQTSRYGSLVNNYYSPLVSSSYFCSVWG